MIIGQLINIKTKSFLLELLNVHLWDEDNKPGFLNNNESLFKKINIILILNAIVDFMHL